MIDISQVVVVAAITVMTIILAVVGIQLIFVLKDVREILKRVNIITSHLENVGLNLEHGYEEVVGFVAGIKKVFNVIDYLAEQKKQRHGKKS